MGIFLSQVASFLTAEFASVFPNLAGIFGTVVSDLLKPQATALHNAMKFFAVKLKSGASWEESATATMNEIGTAEYAILGDVEKHLLQAFMHKSK